MLETQLQTIRRQLAVANGLQQSLADVTAERDSRATALSTANTDNAALQETNRQIEQQLHDAKVGTPMVLYKQPIPINHPQSSCRR